MGVESVNYQCPACGGPLRYDGAKMALVCDHCDSEFSVAEVEALYASRQQTAEEKARAAAGAGVSADGAAGAAGAASGAAAMGSQATGVAGDVPGVSDGDVAGADAMAMGSQVAGTASVTGDPAAASLDAAYVCSSCGAELVCDETTAVSECPYCGNPVVAAGRLSGEFRPQLVAPFKLDREAAKNALAEHYKGKVLLPKSFAGGNRINEVQGVYVPFWLMDARASGSAVYEATRTRRHNEGDDEVIETDHFEVAREGAMAFSRVPVDGSTKMPDAHMDAIEPFDYGALVPFSVAYMPGFVANRYDEDAEACRPRAKRRIEASVAQTLRDSVEGYEAVSCKNCEVSEDWAEPVYALMPVWMLGTTWEGQQFLFAMNGQTGRLVGDLPVDKKKRALIGAAVFAALFAACFAAVRLGGFLSEAGAGAQWGFMLALPLVVALLVCAVLTGQMRSAVEATEAAGYLDASSVDITLRADTYTHTTTQRIHHEKGK